MKKVIKTMMMMLVASAFVLTSCKDEDAEDVVLTLNPSASSGVHFVGDVLSITVNGKGNADNKLKTLTITKAPEGKPTTTVISEKLSGTDKIYTLKDTFELSEVGKITYTIKLEGESGTAQTATYVATVVAVNPIDVETNNVSLFGQTQDAEHFMALTNPFSRYTLDATEDEWKNEVDLAYFYGTTNKHSITSPSNTTMQGLFTSAPIAAYFSGSRVTGFYRMPSSDYTIYNKIVTEDDDRSLVSYAEGKVYTDAINNLVNGEILLFKTKDGHLGMIKIFSLTGIQASDAEMQFQLLAQHIQ